MTESQSAAYVQANAVAALIEAMGMAAENTRREHLGFSIAYGEEAFNKLIDHYGIHDNAMLKLFHQ